jgi:hypothetical protein
VTLLVFGEDIEIEPRRASFYGRNVNSLGTGLPEGDTNQIEQSTACQLLRTP